MKLLKFFMYTCLVSVLGSCTIQRQQNAVGDYNKKITLESGQSVTIGRNDNSVRIKVINIQDNRCPKEVQCVWQGYVNVEFELLTPENRKSAFALCLGSCENINKGSKLNVVPGVKTFRITLFEVGENNTVVFSVKRI
ncbi:MAG TPA: hypothetical protein VGD22_17505 [Sphingobacteriaceae bacterium]